MVRVFVVDDAPFIRKALTRVLSMDPNVTVVGEASRGDEALELIQEHKPDLVTLDVDLPGLDGISTLMELHRRMPRLPVVMMSAMTHEGADVTLDALSAGAVDFIDKSRLNMMDFRQVGDELLDKVKVWGSRDSVRPRTPENDYCSSSVAEMAGINWSRYDVCVIGASTGGPAAIERILMSARPDFNVPLVIVQHMPTGFTRPFAERLNSMTPLHVREATHGITPAPGEVIIARSGRHLMVDQGLRIRLAREPSDAMHRPSIDVTMYSASCAAPEGRAVGILLTGMGGDGAEGLYAIRRRGGLTIAEHEDTCVVPGMPHMARRRGGVVRTLRLPEIAHLFG